MSCHHSPGIPITRLILRGLRVDLAKLRLLPQPPPQLCYRHWGNESPPLIWLKLGWLGRSRVLVGEFPSLVRRIAPPMPLGASWPCPPTRRARLGIIPMAALFWGGNTIDPIESTHDWESGSYCLRTFSMDPITSGESGVTADSNRCTTWPLRSTRNFVKFH
jgi:hypothetical protein